MKLAPFFIFLLSFPGFVRADGCANSKVPRLAIVATTVEQGHNSPDTHDAIEVERQFADVLAAKMRDSKDFCLVRTPSSDSTHSVAGSAEAVVFEVSAVTSLDPHTPNIAAIAVKVHGEGRRISNVSSLPPIPILIENERDFETGARVVMYEWARTMKMASAETKSNR
jgi:hypothetical protein